MPHAIQMIKAVPVKYLSIEVPVRYDDEDMPYDFPLRSGDMWRGTVDLDTHQIIEWPKGKAGSFYMKVVDEGTYILMDENNAEVAAIRENYVPNDLVPGEYGDYIHLDIDENGIVKNWPDSPGFDAFESVTDY